MTTGEIKKNMALYEIFRNISKNRITFVHMPYNENNSFYSIYFHPFI